MGHERNREILVVIRITLRWGQSRVVITVRSDRRTERYPAALDMFTRLLFNSDNLFGITGLGWGMRSTECHSSFYSVFLAISIVSVSNNSKSA